MKLLEKVDKEIKVAMLEKDHDKRDVLRAIKSNASLAAKEKHIEVTDELMISAINKEIKQLNQTLNSLVGKEETELFKGSEYRIGVLGEYLPKLMTKEEVCDEVGVLLQGKEQLAFGEKMKLVMLALKGKADGSIISEAVKLNK